MDFPPSSQATCTCGALEVNYQKCGTSRFIHALRACLPFFGNITYHVPKFSSFPSFPVRKFPVGPVSSGRSGDSPELQDQQALFFFPSYLSPPTPSVPYPNNLSTPIVCGGLFERVPLPSSSAFFVGVYFLCSCVVFASFLWPASDS